MDPTESPSPGPTQDPTPRPTGNPSEDPTFAPTVRPTAEPSMAPTLSITSTFQLRFAGEFTDTSDWLDSQGIPLDEFGLDALESMMGDEYDDVHVTVDDVRSGSVLIEHTLSVDESESGILLLENVVQEMMGKVGSNYSEPYTGNNEFSWTMLSYDAVNVSASDGAAVSITEPLFKSSLEIYIFSIAVGIAVCILGALLGAVHYSMRSKKKRRFRQDQQYMTDTVMEAEPNDDVHETAGGPDHGAVTDFTVRQSPSTRFPHSEL